ncbi:hypothetical protein [Leptospira ellisii]|uniref:hypothetical protein n=1 Tax=Leptospira ellisii TaxID=2023197 RepID=UPI000CC2920A|nr:hypothetical protein CH375_15330 [Leptospira ellisii]
MSRSSRKNPASFSRSSGNDCLMRVTYAILTATFFLCGFCVPADPEYRQKVLENVKDTGFISREFFQILVKVPLPSKDAGILELRNQCRKIAETKRDEIAVSILLTTIRESDFLFAPLRANPGTYTGPTLPPQIASAAAMTSAPGGMALSTGTVSNTATATTQTATANNASANPSSAGSGTNANLGNLDVQAAAKSKEKAAKQLSQDALVYRGAFSWFLNSMFLFREDYSDPANCTFIYRNIQKDLYANVIRKGIQPLSKQEDPEAP